MGFRDNFLVVRSYEYILQDAQDVFLVFSGQNMFKMSFVWFETDQWQPQ